MARDNDLQGLARGDPCCPPPAQHLAGMLSPSCSHGEPTPAKRPGAQTRLCPEGVHPLEARWSPM